MAMKRNEKLRLLKFLETSSSNRVIEAKNEIKSLNESVQILIKIFNKYKNIDLEISKGFLEQFYFISNEIKLHTTNRIGNEEYYDFDVEKLVETQEFEFLMDKLYLIVNFNSNHMTNEENQEDVNIKNKLRDYLQSLRVLTNVLTLNIYKLKTTSINDEIINDWKERINVTKIIDVLFFNKENLDLGHDNLVSLNNPIEIVDDDNKIRKKKLYKNKFVAEQEIGFLPNRNDVKKLENELIKLKSLEKCQNILKYTSVLLNLSLDPILCDFGSVKYENPILFKSTKYQQDSRYTAPEVLKSDNSTYTRSSDVYSFSILLWEIAMQTFPFGKIDSNLIKNKILNDNERPQPNDFDKMEGIPKKYHKIMIQGWNSDVKKRPTIGEVRKDLIDCINTRSPLTTNPPSIFISKPATSPDDGSEEVLYEDIFSETSSICDYEFPSPTNTTRDLLTIAKLEEYDTKTLINSSRSSIISNDAQTLNIEDSEDEISSEYRQHDHYNTFGNEKLSEFTKDYNNKEHKKVRKEFDDISGKIDPKEAVELTDPVAQFEYAKKVLRGGLNDNGKNVKALESAEYCLKKSAEQGYKPAQKMLKSAETKWMHKPEKHTGQESRENGFKNKSLATTNTKIHKKPELVKLNINKQKSREIGVKSKNGVKVANNTLKSTTNTITTAKTTLFPDLESSLSLISSSKSTSSSSSRLSSPSKIPRLVIR
ncbi:12564_t:CDS:2 [Entrophospora sp. SA101]|nr:12564_t:CDS:2 [Entrophospora sp. SA101]